MRRTSSGWCTASKPPTSSVPACGFSKRGDGVDERRLAGPVRAEQGGEAAGLGDQVEPVEGHGLAVVLDEARSPR